MDDVHEAMLEYREEPDGFMLSDPFIELVPRKEYPNYYELTRPTLAGLIPFPHKFYIPGRLREMYRPRLEAAELWDVDEQREEYKQTKELVKEKVSDTPSETFKKAFATERVRPSIITF